MSSIPLGFVLLLAGFQSFAQTDSPHSQSIQVVGSVLDSLALRDVNAVSQDALGNLYLATAQGELMKLNQQLSVEQRFSSAMISRLSALEATQTLKIFAFYQNSQQFQFFDRFLTPSQTNRIKTKTPGHFSAATLSNDQMIWGFDDINTRLIKYNPILEDVVLQTDMQYFLPAHAQVKGLKEYGNRLYLWHNDELIVFDFLGNLIQKLPVEIKKPFTFYEDQLYYPEGRQMWVYDLLSKQQKRYDFSLAEEVRFVVRVEDKLFLITKDQVKVFQFEP